MLISDSVSEQANEVGMHFIRLVLQLTVTQDCGSIKQLQVVDTTPKTVSEA